MSSNSILVQYLMCSSDCIHTIGCLLPAKQNLAILTLLIQHCFIPKGYTLRPPLSQLGLPPLVAAAVTLLREWTRAHNERTPVSRSHSVLQATVVNTTDIEVIKQVNVKQEITIHGWQKWQTNGLVAAGNHYTLLTNVYTQAAQHPTPLTNWPSKFRPNSQWHIIVP